MDEPVSHSTSSGDAALSPDDTPGDDVARQTTVPPSRAVGTPVPKSRSLDDVHNSVPVSYPGFAKRLFAFLGPAYLISVGYMDPGNWATDLAGGARYGYTLLSVIMLSNLMAILLQALAARLGIASGRDLAQACRDSYSRPVTIVLWILCEIAIAACDLAEDIGAAIALNLLFGLPLIWGVVLTALATIVSYSGQQECERWVSIVPSRIDGRLDSAALAMVQCASYFALSTERCCGRMLKIFSAHPR